MTPTFLDPSRIDFLNYCKILLPVNSARRALSITYKLFGASKSFHKMKESFSVSEILSCVWYSIFSKFRVPDILQHPLGFRLIFVTQQYLLSVKRKIVFASAGYKMTAKIF